MAWTTPHTWAADEMVDAPLLNAHIRDNLNYLLARPLSTQSYLPGSAYSTTSTSWADVDATNLKVTITPSSSRVLVLASLVGYAHNQPTYNGNSLALTFSNGTTRLGHATYGLGALPDSLKSVMSIQGVFTGLTPGTAYTLTLQYKAGVAGVVSEIVAQMVGLVALEV